MSVDLRTGVLGLNYGWITILQQEGISFSEIKDVNNLISNKSPILIIGEFYDTAGKEKLLEYVNSGGMLLVSGKVWKQVFQNKTTKSYCSYLMPQPNSYFSSAGLTNIDHSIEYPTQNNLVFDKSLYIYKFDYGDGTILIYPFDINKLMLTSKSTRRNFYYSGNELPSEVVCAVSKSGVRKIMCLCLEYLWNQKDLPFIQQWYFPERTKSLFCFRIDTDFCTKTQAKNLYNLCKKFEIPATWFIETSSITMLKEVYSNFKNQEMAFHGNRHLVFKTKTENLENIRIGLRKLKDVGINDISGFAGPFGEWNESLGESLENNFSYSSEFSYDYDNLPSYPIVNGIKSNVIQIPIHPVSVGRLKRSHYSLEEMKNYYDQLIDDKVNNNEPVILYYHPGNDAIEVVKFIFNKITSMKLQKMFMSDFADYWKTRINNIPVYKFSNSILTGHNNVQDNQYIHIKLNGKHTLEIANKYIELKKLKFKQKKISFIPNDIKKLRQFSWRHYLYNFELSKSKTRM